MVGAAVTGACMVAEGVVVVGAGWPEHPVMRKRTGAPTRTTRDKKTPLARPRWAVANGGACWREG
jgi:hypothetical protein